MFTCGKLVSITKNPASTHQLQQQQEILNRMELKNNTKTHTTATNYASARQFHTCQWNLI